MILNTGRAQLRAFSRALGFVRPYWHIYLLLILFGIITSTIAAIPVMLVSKIQRFVHTTQPSSDPNVCYWSSLASLLYIAIPLTAAVLFNQVVFNTLGTYLRWFLGMRITLHLRTQFFRHLQRLPLSFHQERPVGELIYRANSDIDASVPVVLVDIPALIGAAYASILYIYLLITTGSPLIIAYLSCFVPFYIGAHVLYTIIRRLDYRWRVRSQQLTATLRESIAGARVVKAFDKTRFEGLKYFHRLSDFYRANMRRFFTNIVAMNVQQVGLSMGFPFLYSILAIFVLLGKFAPIQYMGMLVMCNLTVFFVESFYQKFQGLRVSVVPIQRLFETLDIEPAIQEKPDAVRLEKLDGRIEFDGVSFSYVPGETVLKNATFSLEPGRKLGIVGPSGAGKSTLAQLLLRGWDPDSGTVRIDGYDVRDLRMNTVLKNMGVILQQTDLFGGTIADNIRYGKPEATDEEVFEAARAAGLHDDVVALPFGYETEVGEGEKLSGGQRQRVSIARALVKKPSLLLLDEPTASLDPRTASHIGATLRAISARTTTLIISHRLSDVEDSDLILVMKDGSIVERGTHAELLAVDGVYRSLHRQAAMGGDGKEHANA